MTCSICERCLDYRPGSNYLPGLPGSPSLCAACLGGLLRALIDRFGLVRPGWEALLEAAL